MWGLLFEVRAKPGHWDAYFEHVDRLKPRLAAHPGLLWLERFRRADDPDTLLSHQFWESPEAIAAWRADPVHRASQSAGRRVHFEDYRIRVGPECAAAEADVALAYGSAAAEMPGAVVYEGLTRPGHVVTLLPAAAAAAAEGQAGIEAVRGFRIVRDYTLHDRAQAPA